eukprot:m.227720 g.227720  ORF g.227720 m.227720 type:complete len:263 (-) comp10851_c4_seq4:1233-2021(-)
MWRRMPRVRGVVFDMDGTLTAPHAIDFARIRARCGLPAFSEHDPATHSIVEMIRSMGDPVREAHCMAIVEEEEELGLAQMAPNRGLDALCSTLVRLGIRAGISTRNNERALKRFHALLGEIGVQALNSAVVFEPQLARDALCPVTGRVLLNKPHPDSALAVMRAWGFASAADAGGHLLMVGDAFDDLRCGRSAGLATCLVTNGADADPASRTSRELRAHGHLADFVVRDLTGVAELLERLHCEGHDDDDGGAPAAAAAATNG